MAILKKNVPKPRILLLLFLIIIPFLVPLSATSSSTVPLTDAEIQWLKSHPVITLAPDPDFKPIEFFDKNGHYEGAAADIIRLVEKKLGITITIAHLKNWDEAMAKFKTHEVDLLGAMVKTPNREKFALFTDTLVSVPGGIFARSGSPTGLTLNDLIGKKVAVVSNYAAHDVMKERYQGTILDVVPDVSTGLAKASLGMVDAYVENMANATYYLQEAGITNLQMVGKTNFDYSWGIGIRKDWPELQSILNKALATISEEERQQSLQRWVHVDTGGWRPTKTFVAGAIAATFGLLLLLVVYWNHSLRKVVGSRTASLQKELEERHKAEAALTELSNQLEVKVRERTDELALQHEKRLKLEQQMLHAQKLESLGVLAGGIAHDFNNILTAIIGNADLALMRINKESPAVDNLHRIEQAAARAADLARQMLAYSGKGKFIVESIDMNILLEEMLHMLEVSISKKAVLRLNKYQYLPQVEADATQMRQIIMNLVINASEAIGDRSGIIAITTGCMDCDRSYLKDVWLDENLTDGLYVYLEIADTGCGMDRDTLAKLFDPFFTTKFTGRGLGMAAVLGIIRGHKGAIKVYSEVDKGTTFKILFPASGKPADIFNGGSPADIWHGCGTVLLVDDEETIRGTGAEMLKELGFTTITADDGRAAVTAFKENPGIAFVLLDLTMPHMDGEQCFRELRQLDPDVKVIMSSGYNEQEVTQKFVGKGLAGFIQKPYKLSALREAIRHIHPAGTTTRVQEN